MTPVPGVAKASQAATDLKRLLDVTDNTCESHGREQPHVKGDIQFKAVTFAYPTRQDVPVLRGVSFNIPSGACVGIVG
jgi:ABC-type bacteriocin/lantibiotic exporter with double-glycine peptidase domain